MNKYEFKRIEIPLSRQFTDEIVKLWESVFEGNSFTFLEDSLLGNELNASKNVLYFVIYENMVVSTLRLIHSKSDSRLGYLGEAATLPEHRGNKLMGNLLQQAIDEFIKIMAKDFFLLPPTR